MNEIEVVQRLADEELVVRTTDCARNDRCASALLLAHLGEIDARKLYRDLGYESMFIYAVRGLHMSESEAALRLYAAKFARKFPASLDMLRRGELHLTAMKLLQPVLTDDNIELLDKARLKTKQELQTLIAKYCPQDDVPTTIRRLPSAHGADTSAPLRAGEQSSGASSLSLFAVQPTARGSLEELSNTTTACAESSPRNLSRGAGATFEHSNTSTKLDRLSVTPSSVDSAKHPSSGRTDATSRPPTGQASRDAVGTQGWAGASQDAVYPREHAQAATDAVGVRGRDEMLERARVVSSTAPANRFPATALREGRYKIQFTTGQRVRDLIEQAQELCRNQVPTGDIAVIFEHALELLVAQRKKQLFAQTARPRRAAAGSNVAMRQERDSEASRRRSGAPHTNSPTSQGSVRHEQGPTHASSKARSRHIPNEVKRRVFARDLGRCTFIGPSGDRCDARSRLEFHHVHAFGLGGAATESNIVLFCRTHNQLLAERDFSREHIDRCIRASRARTESSTAGLHEGERKVAKREPLGNCTASSRSAPKQWRGVTHQDGTLPPSRAPSDLPESRRGTGRMQSKNFRSSPHCEASEERQVPLREPVSHRTKRSVPERRNDWSVRP